MSAQVPVDAYVPETGDQMLGWPGRPFKDSITPTGTQEAIMTVLKKIRYDSPSFGASTSWVITHNLNMDSPYRPLIMIFDSAGNRVFGEYADYSTATTNSVTLNFTAPLAGSATVFNLPNSTSIEALVASILATYVPTP